MCAIHTTGVNLYAQGLQLMMMHHNTKFGNKMFVSLEHIIWTNIDALTLCCDLDLDFSNPFFFSFVLVVFFSQNTLAYDVAHHIKFGNKIFCGSEDTIRTNIH